MQLRHGGNLAMENTCTDKLEGVGHAVERRLCHVIQNNLVPSTYTTLKK